MVTSGRKAEPFEGGLSLGWQPAGWRLQLRGRQLKLEHRRAPLAAAIKTAAKQKRLQSYVDAC